LCSFLFGGQPLVAWMLWFVLGFFNAMVLPFVQKKETKENLYLFLVISILDLTCEKRIQKNFKSLLQF